MNKKSVFHIPSNLTDPTLMTKSRGYSVRNISIFVALFSVVLVVVSYRGLERSQKLVTTSLRYTAPLEHSVQLPSETVGDKERESLSEKVKALGEEIAAFQASHGKANSRDTAPLEEVLQEHSVQSPSETVGDKERESLSEKVKALREEIAAFHASRGKANSRDIAPLEEVLQEHSVQSPSETVGDKERESLSEGVKALREEIAAFHASRGKAKKDVDPMTALLIKLAFSVFFGLAAMYVVLSKKYDDETKKWAFSVLALISGVWIGTAS